MSVQTIKNAARVKAITGIRLSLKPWEEIIQFVEHDNSITLQIETYTVKEARREDRYEAHGTRLLFIQRSAAGKWSIELEHTIWDEDFEPFVWVKSTNYKTAQELDEQREFEKLCYRPGTPRTPLDSYERCWWDKTTPKMERYW